METAKREHCPYCDSVDMHNLVYMKTGQKVYVYVECADCKKLVARYTLKRYSSAADYNAVLEYYRRRGEMSSGRRILKEVNSHVDGMEEGWERVKELITQHEEDMPIDQIIAEERLED